jgi:glycine cleavage system aminomethyltransferase T
MRSRGSVSHLLVGLSVEGESLPGPHTPLAIDGRIVGELTSAVRSSDAGVIALGFVRRPHDAIGTRLDASGIPATVCALPFVPIVTPGAA